MNMPSAYSPMPLDEARTMLSFIPSEDREIWLQVGMALKDHAGPDAFSIFDDWSSTASNYSAKDCRNTWRSFKGNGRTIASLVYLAQQHGWSSTGRRAFLHSVPTRKPQPAERDTTVYAQQLWLAARFDDDYVGSHPYASRKGIDWAAGARRGNASGKVIGPNADCIIVPVRDIASETLQGVQCINADGKKQSFGKVSSGALILGNTFNKHDPWYVAEGWASAVAWAFDHMDGKVVCACSFGKSNQMRVAHQINEVYAPRLIVPLLEQD